MDWLGKHRSEKSQGKQKTHFSTRTGILDLRPGGRARSRPRILGPLTPKIAKNVPNRIKSVKDVLPTLKEDKRSSLSSQRTYRCIHISRKHRIGPTSMYVFGGGRAAGGLLNEISLPLGIAHSQEPKLFPGWTGTPNLRYR